MSASNGRPSGSNKKKPTEAARRKRPKARLVIEPEACKGCGFCVEFCPTGALELSSEFNRKGYHPPEVIEHDCVYCEMCELICPEFAVYCVEDPEAATGEAGEPTAGAPPGTPAASGATKASAQPSG